MKYILIFLLLISTASFGQVYQNQSAPFNFVRGIKQDTIAVIPRGCDTVALPRLKFGAPTIGAMYYDTCANTLYVKGTWGWLPVTGGLDSLDFPIVIDSTGNPNYRVLFSIGNKISSSGNFFIDSSFSKVYISGGFYSALFQGTDFKGKTVEVEEITATELIPQNDTTTFKPVVVNNSTGKFEKFDKWPGSGGSTDTTSLSNRINLKLNISDTASMLSPYARLGGATFTGFSGYDANRAASYTARSFTDKNYVDSIGNVGWRISGNSGTNATTNFIGTTDAANFSIRVNNIEKILITNGGNTTLSGNVFGTSFIQASAYLNVGGVTGGAASKFNALSNLDLGTGVSDARKANFKGNSTAVTGGNQSKMFGYWDKSTFGITTTGGYAGIYAEPTINTTSTVEGIVWNPTVTATGTHYGLLIGSGRSGFGTLTPAASALVDMTSTTQGVLLPRMTGVQQAAISSPATGLLIYNTDSSAFTYNNGSTWQKVGGGSGGSGTVTSVATGLGLTGGPITTTGTVSLDTANASVLSRQRAAATYLTGSVNTNRLLFSADGSVKDTSILVYDRANARVGIGVASPTQRLHVSGNTLLTGVSVTGAGTDRALNVDATWNTTGTPSLIRGNATNTASLFGRLLDLNVGGTPVLTIPPDGSIRFGNILATGSAIGAGSPTIYGISAAGNAVILAHRVTGTANGFGIVYSILTGSRQPTANANENGTLLVRETFNPTSGTANYSAAVSRLTVNQTGGASGISRGLYIDPVLTAAADYRALEFSNTTGRGLWGAGTAPSALAGGLTIGSAANPAASAVLDITSTTQGLLLPRMTTTQRNAISSPAVGLTVYDTDLKALQDYDGTSWGFRGVLRPGTTAAGTAPLKFTTQAAGLTTVEQGAMELIGNSLQFTQLAKRRGVMMSQNVVVTDTDLNNTVTESSALVTSEHGANYLEVGKCEIITIVGKISQRSNPSATIKFRIKYGGVTIDSVSTPIATVLNNASFELRCYVTFRSVGVSGTAKVNTVLRIDGVTNSPDSNPLVTINTTASQNTTITAEWGEANASNTFQLNQGFITCVENNK